MKMTMHIDEDALDREMKISWALDCQGRSLPAQDILIATHALQADATVLTLEAHFQPIPDLRKIAWVD